MARTNLFRARDAHGHAPTDDNEADALALLHWSMAHGVTA